MKSGYKHATSIFGTDSEYYASSLFMMMKNPNGSRRPDLITMGNAFNPKLSIELKSGRDKKGVLLDYQLHYAVTLHRDYPELFDEEDTDDTLPGLNLDSIGPSSSTPGIAYYYDLVNRVDDVTSTQLDVPYAQIMLRWGDQYVVPHEFGFYNFVVAKMMRTGEPLEDAIMYVLDVMKLHANGRVKDFDEKKGSSSWQNINGRDITSIFFNDMSLATRYGRERIEKMYNSYPGLSSLVRISIDGPNGTTLYILANPEHRDLFDVQLRAVVNKRRGVIEDLTEERAYAQSLLEKIKLRPGVDLFGNEEDAIFDFNMSEYEINLLKRLSHWRAECDPNVFTLEDIPF